MITEDELYGLVLTAREQQAVLQDALAALAKERAALTEAAQVAARGAAQVGRAADGAVADVRKAVLVAVDDAVTRSLADAGKVAADALGGAARPILGELSGVVASAGKAKGKIDEAVDAFGWRWAIVAGSIAGVTVTVIALAAWASVAWERSQVESLAQQRRELTAEVARLQEGADTWAKRAGKAKLETCRDKDDKARLCVRVDKSAAYGLDNDYYVIKGY